MITSESYRLLTENHRQRLLPVRPAVPRGVFMVEPVNFRLSGESAQDNVYMRMDSMADPDRALVQYINLVELIRNVGVPVKNFSGDPRTPEDVFPNNVFATIPGRLIVGHMLHPNRQIETTRADIRRYFNQMGYALFDLSAENCIAELTGPMVIDRARGLGLCGMSGRVDQAGLEAMHTAFDLKYTLKFDLVQGEYHANVVLSVLAGRALIMHADSFADPHVPHDLEALYEGQVMYLGLAEKNAFAANCIALTEHDLFMSQTAADALEPHNRALLDYWGFRLHTAELDEIEKAGGSLRCMVGEIF